MNALLAEKDAIESQLKKLADELALLGSDMASPLIDSEGFPRADIDLYAVRSLRSKILHLQGDQRDIYRRISVGLRSALAPGFARVVEVENGSPGFIAGLKVGDEIVEVNGVSRASSADPMKVLADLPAESVVRVARGAHMLEFCVAGRAGGFYGCRVDALAE